MTAPLYKSILFKLLSRVSVSTEIVRTRMHSFKIVMYNSNDEVEMITGSCLCGKVKCDISGKVGGIVHCHCITCRKAHGSAFSSVAAINDRNFRLSGDELLNSFESSEGKRRYFCSNCGTQIYAKRDGTEHVILRLGSLDNDPQTKEKEHIWVSQKASWYSIISSLPEHQEFD